MPLIEMRAFRVRVPSPRDALIGYEGENQSRQIVIRVDDLGSWQYKLDLERISTKEKFTLTFWHTKTNYLQRLTARMLR